MNNDKLYIPLNVKKGIELFNGFAMRELIYTLIIMAITIPISILIYLINKNILFCIIFNIAILTGTVIFLSRDKNNLCVAKQLKNILIFSTRQKKYKYNYFCKLFGGKNEYIEKEKNYNGK